MFIPGARQNDKSVSPVCVAGEQDGEHRPRRAKKHARTTSRTPTPGAYPLILGKFSSLPPPRGWSPRYDLLSPSPTLNRALFKISAPVLTHLEMVPCSNRPSLSPTPNHSIEMKGYSSFSQYLKIKNVRVGWGVQEDKALFSDPPSGWWHTNTDTHPPRTPPGRPKPPSPGRRQSASFVRSRGIAPPPHRRTHPPPGVTHDRRLSAL